MKSSYWIWIICLIVLSACMPSAQVQPTSTPPQSATPEMATVEPPLVDVPPVETPTASLPPTPYETGIPIPAAAAAAQKSLSEQLKLPASAIQITRIEEVQWPDGCLGLGRPDEMCTQAIVDGFLIVMEANGVSYEYHTNSNGSLLRLAEAEGPKGDVEVPEAVKLARALLGQQLGIDASQVGILQFAAVEWPDACLGVDQTGQVCAAVVTPGYEVTFQAGGKKYIYHTDQTGGRIVAGPPVLALDGTAVVLEQTRAGTCRRLEIDQTGLKTGDCQSALQSVPFRTRWMEDLARFLAAYAPFTASTPAGEITFQGQGEQKATAAEQRSIAEWAGLILLQDEAGMESEKDPSVAFQWERKGGFAGFCDTLTVFRDGSATAENCRTQRSNDQEAFRLDEKQLIELYEWLDGYASFAYVQEDAPGAADSMAVRLTFQGDGDTQASETEQAQFALFAQDVYGSRLP